MRVFIAEKPAAAQAIATELGGGRRQKGFIACGADTVTWCFGHMLEQAEPDAYTPDDVPRTRSGKKVWREDELPIVPKRWRLVIKRDARAQLRVIGDLLGKASVIVHAGDPDREGQLLVDEVLEHFGRDQGVKRFWVSAQDPISIRRGLERLRDNESFAPMADAARARQRADWLIGMNLSRVYTLRARANGSDVLLTVGRVQTPTLNLVVTRDRAIEAFVPAPYFTVHATLTYEAGSFVATYKPGEAQEGLDSEGRIVKPDLADAVVAAVTGQNGAVSEHCTEDKKERPPLPFSLSDLTVVASKRFGYTAEQVLHGCQSLYETHKLVSYPRSDCRYLPLSQYADAPAVLAAIARVNSELNRLVVGADANLCGPCWNDGKVTAHHGIIPTMARASREQLSERERNLYDLIARRYLAQFYADHRYQQTQVSAEIAAYEFVATGKVTGEQGWRVCEPGAEGRGGGKAGRDSEQHQQALPQMTIGDAVLVTKAARQDKKTKAPPRYTEGSLLRAMEQIHREVSGPEIRKQLRESDGIGTPATRATIIGELKRRGFLAAHNKHLQSTEIGRALVDALPLAVQSPALTALYERTLGDIEAGKATVDGFVRQQAAFVTERVAEAKARPLVFAAKCNSRRPRRGRRGGKGQ